MPTNMTLFSINAILILSTDDRSRILTKYYSPPHSQPHASHSGAAAGATTTSSAGSNPYGTVKEQKAFEKGLMDKTNKQSGDVILYDGRVVVYKMEGDVMLYVVGGGDENEILLFGVVLALRDSLAILLKNSTDKRTLIENYDLVSLAIDEIVDDGIILEVDPVVVASRVTRPPAQDVSGVKGIDLSEQGIMNAWELLKAKGVERIRQL
ncbi:Golgi-to-ER vesicle coat component [Pseudocyphellaria aurata]|nr:Golgi-to-ER vesicle coat component [Pseudocyphellaria aurata]